MQKLKLQAQFEDKVLWNNLSLRGKHSHNKWSVGAQNPQTGLYEKYIHGYTSILTSCTWWENIGACASADGIGLHPWPRTAKPKLEVGYQLINTIFLLPSITVASLGGCGVRTAPISPSEGVTTACKNLIRFKGDHSKVAKPLNVHFWYC